MDKAIDKLSGNRMTACGEKPSELHRPVFRDRFTVVLIAIFSWFAIGASGSIAQAPTRPAGGGDAEFAGLEAASEFLRGQRTVFGREAVAAALAHDGTWRLRTREGATFTASGRYELRTAERWLRADGDLVAAANNSDEPTDAGATADKPSFALVIAAKGLAEAPGALSELTPSLVPHVLLAGRPYRVVAGSEGPAYAVANKRLFVSLADDESAAETLWQLRRRVPARRLHVIAFREGAPTPAPNGIFAESRPDAVGGVVEQWSPREFLSKISRFRGEFVVVSGKIEDGELMFAQGAAPDPDFQLAALRERARRAGVDLIVLNTDSTTQPGETNMIWQSVDVAGIGEAAKAPTLGELLSRLNFDRGAVRVELERATNRFEPVRMRVRPVGGLTALLPGSGEEGAGAAIVGVLDDLLSVATGDVVARSVEATLTSRARANEISARAIPWLPAWLQYLYLALLAIGCLGLRTAVGWWHKIWPPMPLTSYGSVAEMVIRRSGRLALFIALFLPAVALAALPMEVTRLFTAIGAAGDRQSEELG